MGKINLIQRQSMFITSTADPGGNKITEIKFLLSEAS